MARKKRKNSRVSKVNGYSVNSQKPLILFEASTEEVAVPDFDIRIKRKRGYSLVPFVTKDCLVETTSPVVRFVLKVNPMRDNREVKDLKLKKKRGTGFSSIQFVPKDCSDAKISVGYRTIQHERIPCSGYFPTFGTSKNKKRKVVGYTGEFVSPGCIASEVSQGFRYVKESKVFHNPYLDMPGYAPQIIGGASIIRRKSQVGGCGFIPASCITDKVSIPYPKALGEPAKMSKNNYTYVERPNSPDIIDDKPKRNKKKRGQAVPFVPKSCTTDQKPNTVLRVSSEARAEALALEAPTPKPETNAGSNWVLIGIISLILVALAGYILQK